MLKARYIVSIGLQEAEAKELEKLKAKRIRPIDIFRLGLATMLKEK